MKVEVILHAGLLDGYDFEGKEAVVIDAFRATSVIVEGLCNGAKSIIPVESVAEAMALKSANPALILGGERDGVLIEGFDLDNSPLSYSLENVKNKEIALTTTNGTRAMKGVTGAAAVYLGAFLNVSAVANKVSNAKNLVIVCSGSENTVSLEDSLCAGAIIYYLESLTSIEWSDTAYMLKTLYKDERNDLAVFLSKGEHYKELVSKGFENDVQFCLQLSKRSVVPYYDGTTVKR
jgi:2-phosphosulfolactate phosphatase